MSKSIMITHMKVIEGEERVPYFILGNPAQMIPPPSSPNNGIMTPPNLTLRYLHFWGHFALSQPVFNRFGRSWTQFPSKWPFWASKSLFRGDEYLESIVPENHHFGHFGPLFWAIFGPFLGHGLKNFKNVISPHPHDKISKISKSPKSVRKR